MEQKLSDTLVKAIDRSNPMMQNLQLASRFNKLVEEGGGSADLEDNKEVTITENGEIEITPSEGKDGMKKVTATVQVAGSGGTVTAYAWSMSNVSNCMYFPIDIAPADKADYLVKCAKGGQCQDSGEYFEVMEIATEEDEYTRISDDSFTVGSGEMETTTLTRNPDKDFILWS